MIQHRKYHVQLSAIQLDGTVNVQASLFIFLHHETAQSVLLPPVSNVPTMGPVLMKKLALRLLSSFDDCATLFTFSIQIASIVVLARVEYGLSATAMGDVTVRTNWTVSALTLFP